MVHKKQEKIPINGLVQDCSNSSALAMELLQPSTKPSIYCHSLMFLYDMIYCGTAAYGE